MNSRFMPRPGAGEPRSPLEGGFKAKESAPVRRPSLPRRGGLCPLLPAVPSLGPLPLASLGCRCRARRGGPAEQGPPGTGSAPSDRAGPGPAPCA